MAKVRMPAPTAAELAAHRKQYAQELRRLATAHGEIAKTRAAIRVAADHRAVDGDPLVTIAAGGLALIRSGVIPGLLEYVSVYIPMPNGPRGQPVPGLCIPILDSLDRG